MERNKNGIFYVVISLFVVFSILFTAVPILKAYSVSQNINVAGDYIYNEAENQDAPDDVSFGAFPGGDIYNPVVFYDTFGFGEGREKSEYFYRAIKMDDATVTPALFDPNAEGYNDFYLVDVWVTNESKSTTSIGLCVTTSTVTYVAADFPMDNCTLLTGLGNAFGADGATFDSGTATGSNYFLRQYPGTDTRLAAGTNPYPFLVNSTTNILVHATSSGDGNWGVVQSASTLEGTLHIIGKKTSR